MTDWYEVLEVEHTASPEAIYRAYRRAILQSHPDKNPNASAEQFLLVKQAFEVLSDPETRRSYDASKQHHLTRHDADREYEKAQFKENLAKQERAAVNVPNTRKIHKLRLETEKQLLTLQQIVLLTRSQQPQFRTLADGSQQFETVAEARQFIDEHSTKERPLTLQDSFMEGEYSERLERETLNRLPL